jgi:hypothetical protein
MKNKYIIDVKFQETFDATSKARKDINDILVKEGFSVKFINIPKANSYKELYKNIGVTYKQLISILDEVEDNSTLLFQYPWDSFSYKFSKTILKYKKFKNLKTIVLIHDLNSLRSQSFFGRLYYKKYIKEYKYLNNFDYVICHNSEMKKLLVNNKANKAKIIELGVFDYLTDTDNSIDSGKYKSVSLAGNLSREKSAYVYDLCAINQKEYKLELFGVGFEKGDYKNVTYNGAFPPSELNSHINFGFGLVWDGNSIDKLDGDFGKYEYYNNPHKLSLYLSCGIPVIVSKEAAISKFVKKNNVGIVIDNLNNLSKVMKKITKRDYNKMLKNVSVISNKVKNGYYTIEAIKKCK